MAELTFDANNNLNVNIAAGGGSGTTTIVGNRTNNTAPPDANEVGVLPALANAAAPTWTEGDQVLASVDLSGHQRVVATGSAAADAAQSGNPVLIGGVDNAGNVQELPVADSGTTVPSQLLMIGFEGVTGHATSVILGGGQTLPVAQTGTDTDAGTNNLCFMSAGGGSSSSFSLSTSPHLFNGTTWDRQRSATVGNAVAATGIPTSAAYGEYLSTAPAPTTGQYSALQTDYAGSLFVKPIRRSNTAASKATITNSSVAVTVMPAQAAGIFADISHLDVTVTAAATVSLPFTLTLSDGTATYVYDMVTGALATSPADGTVLSLDFNPPLPATTAATAWTIATNVATVTVHAVSIAILQKAS